MHSTYLRRTILLLTLLIFTAVNMVGAYYSENLYNFNTFGEMLIFYKAAPLATNISIYGLTYRLHLAGFGLVLAVHLLPIYLSQSRSWQLVASAALLCVSSVIVSYIGWQSNLVQIAAGLIYFIAQVLILYGLVSTYFYSTNTA